MLFVFVRLFVFMPMFVLEQLLALALACWGSAIHLGASEVYWELGALFCGGA